MVTDDPVVALRELERGENVVLIVGQQSEPDGEPRARQLASPIGSGGLRTGRLAVMIGDRSDPATLLAAQEMDDELFRSGR